MKYDLIARAKEALRGNRRPKAVILRRAVSDSYYALFHALCQMSADAFVGVTQRQTDAWRRMYRGHSHSFMKDELKRSETRQINVAFARIGTAFILLQENRHIADYDPWTPYRRRGDVQPLISAADAAIQDIDNLTPDLARQLGAIILFKNR